MRKRVDSETFHLDRIWRCTHLDGWMNQKHSYNRQAFQGGGNEDNPLLSLYCSLIDIELALKDHFPTWRSGHSIAQWLNDVGETSLSTQLREKLGLLQCTGKNGNGLPVDADRYPAIRYLRHQEDFTDGIPTQHIEKALQIVKQIQRNLPNTLARRGSTP